MRLTPTSATRLCLLLLLLATAAGCGQKGPLRLPDQALQPPHGPR